jgi:uncharacterized membrane protein
VRELSEWWITNAALAAVLLAMGAAMGASVVLVWVRQSARRAERYQRRLVRFKRAVRQEVARMVDEDALTKAYRGQLSKKDARSESGVERFAEHPVLAEENKTVVLQSSEIFAVRGDGAG